jgi:hypothetical protein
VTNEDRFDDLARKLAQPRTRRGALRAAAGGIGGLLLGAFGLKASGAEAGPRVNPCTKWCTDNFSSRADRAACQTAAANGEGPCYECGAAAPPDSPPFCNGVCCGENEECVDGECVATCEHDDAQGDCSGQLTCNDSPGTCGCSRTWDDGVFCHQFTSCGSVTDCSTDADCPAGYQCAYSCCSGLKCLPECGTVTAAAAVTGAMSGPS